jgi:hypothetical protein
MSSETHDPFVPGPRATPKKRSRAKRVASIAAAVAIPIAIVASAPWMIDLADTADEACWESDYEEPGSSADCEGRAALWLVIPKLVPWTRDGALEMERDITRTEARRAVMRAVEIEPNRTARDRALERYFELDASAALAFARVLGARGPLLAHADRSSDSFDRESLMNAAVLEGDLARAAELARHEVPAASPVDPVAKRAALLCLAGEDDAGRSVLSDARTHGNEWRELHQHLASVACGDSLPSVTEFERDAILSAEILAGREPDVMRRLAERTYGGGDRTPLVAEWITDEEPSLEDVLDQLWMIATPLPHAWTPWLVAYPTSETGPLAIEPGRAERAADYLDDTRARLESGETTLDLDARDRELEHREDAIRARANAPRLLQERARLFRALAMMAFASYRPRQAEILARGLMDESEPPELRLTAASVFMRTARDPEGARATLESLVRTEADAVRVFAHVNLALLDLGASENDSAHQHALRAQALSREPGGVPNARSGLLVIEDARDALEWLLLATSIATGRTGDAPGRWARVFRGRDVRWAALPGMNARARRRARLGIDGVPGLLGGPEWVAPAYLYVLYRSVGDDGDPEVWVDDALGPGGVRLMEARAEASRWCGRASDAGAWRHRAWRIRSRVNTPNEAFLAHLAGLDL